MPPDQPQQKSLFDDSPASPWEVDDEAARYVATVVFTGPLAGEFDYEVPDKLRDTVSVGCRVRVPLGRGNRPEVGYCVRVETRTDVRRSLKKVQGVVDERSLLSPAMLRLTQWIAEHYLCSWGQVLEAVVPAGVRGQAGTREARYLSVPEILLPQLATVKLPAKQKQVLRIAAEAPEPLTPADLARAAGCRVGPVNALVAKGLLVSRTRRTKPRAAEQPVLERQANLTLNPDQARTVDAIVAALRGGRHETILLRGVTGSGKTEVYIQAIQEVVSFGRQAIVLVPEISLTPQTVERFRSRFPQVAVLHSHLTDSERHWHWERIAAGEVNVVVGARSAVFAPTPHLGLIVIDEEHEGSFKQDSAPRYHARDVALERARAERAPLVLGSATPALESYHRASTGEFRLLELPKRVEDRPMPGVEIIDMRQASLERYTGSLSRKLRMNLERELTAGGQAILLLNRRGFSTHIQCQRCGHVVKCPSCDIALTWHRQADAALCHYCDFQIPTLRNCPECNFNGIRYAGLGTQRLEAEVRAMFPKATCLRMDTDTMQSPGSHERALARFRSGEVQVLLGTQMIAKGLDFPNVTLVGVVNADMALHLPDFRAAERTFQLLVQVAGRTGRGVKGGRVFVQTYSPDHPAILAAARHDYVGFAADALAERQPLGYPPFGELVRLVIRGPRANQALEFAQLVAEELRKSLAPLGTRARVLGPAPAAIAKLRDKHRFNLQLQSADGVALRAAVRDILERSKPPTDVDWMADVDPTSML